MTTSRAQKLLIMRQPKHKSGFAKGTRTVLLQACSYAGQDDVIIRNSITDTTLQKVEKKTVASFDSAQIKDLRSHLDNDLRDAFDLKLGTGLRTSEVLALRWKMRTTPRTMGR